MLRQPNFDFNKRQGARALSQLQDIIRENKMPLEPLIESGEQAARALEDPKYWPQFQKWAADHAIPAEEIGDRADPARLGVVVALGKAAEQMKNRQGKANAGSKKGR